MTSQEIRAVLDEIELANTKINGYGSRNFAHAILERPLKLLEGVEDTIAELSTRHELTLFTRGIRRNSG